MDHIPMRAEGAYDRNNLCTINERKKQGIKTIQNIAATGVQNNREWTPGGAATTEAIEQRKIPVMHKLVQKGQKVQLELGMPLSNIKACFGWNTTNAQCDVDVSAYLLGTDGKVLGDNWFVFYGQKQSPDGCVKLQTQEREDRQSVCIDLAHLNSQVKKIVFVLTINEAFEKHLNFGMMKDAYIRILDIQTGQELTAFQMTEYYANVISMMIGEVYNHNGTWKFNAIGNGVAKDLAGLCQMYGVQVDD